MVAPTVNQKASLPCGRDAFVFDFCLFHRLFDVGGNGDGHTDHRVVTRADQARHLYAYSVW